jgi:opacity protein-like surface antigen
MRVPSVVLAVVILVTVVTAAAPASAQWFVDVYLGAAKTSTADVDVTQGGVTTSDPVAYTSSVTLGVRGGRWFDALPWLGVALDASFFKTSADFTVIPISALVMARYPILKSDDYPEGRLHPYVGVGPGLFFSSIGGGLGNLRSVDDTSVNLGLDMRAGVAYPIEKNIFLFGEYRFTHVSPDFSFDQRGTATTADTTLNTHHFLLGVSFRF